MAWEAFNTYAQEYDSWYDRHYNIFKLELEALREIIGEEIPKASLEIGAGTGRFACSLGIRFGLEPAHSMALMAKERGVIMCRGVAEETPFKDNSFYLILLNTTLCFLNNPQKALSEIRRILRPQGSLVVGIIDRESPLGKRYQMQKEKSKFYRHARFYSPQEVFTLLENTGFKYITCRRIKLNEKDTGSFVVIHCFKSTL